MKSRQKNILEKITLFAGMTLMLWANKGIMSCLQDYLPSYTEFALVIIFFFFASLAKKDYLKNYFLYSFPLIIFTTVIFFVNILNNGSISLFLDNCIYIIVLSGIYFFIKDNKNKKLFLILYLIDTLFISFNTIAQTTILGNPLLPRLLSTGTYGNTVKGVGSYSFIYTLPILIIAILERLRLEKKPKLRFLYIFIIIIYLITLILAKFFISYFLLFFLVLLYVFLLQKKSTRNKILLIGIPLFFIIVTFVIPPILTKLGNDPNANYIVRDRANDLLLIYNGNISEGTDLPKRLDKYIISLDAITESYLIGNWDISESGQHSSWLDMIAVTGVFSIIFFYALYKIQKDNAFYGQTERLRSRKIIILYYIILGIINITLTAGITTAIFLILPLLLPEEKRPSKDKKNCRILWTTNVIMPYPAQKLGKKSTVFGGWLKGLFNEIVRNQDYELGIASVYGGRTLREFHNKKVTYYLVPSKIDIIYQPETKKYWQKIVKDFQPDLIHLHGTEYAHNLALQNACPDEKYLVSIQGLLKPYAEAYTAGLSEKEIVQNRTLMDRIAGGIIGGKKSFEKRSIYEKQILKRADAITGRTKWDHDESLKIAGDKPYYRCNEILRPCFYDAKWKVKEIEQHSIYISQATYPIKGFHTMLDAMPELIKKYPDLKVYVGGTNILNNSSLRDKVFHSGYSKILKKRIEAHKLEKYLTFLGELSEEKVLEKMKKCNVFVQCSSIENSSNSLGEAMLIGMPCIASNVGGTADLLTDKEDGFLYEFGDSQALSKHIDEIFSNNKLATSLGESAQKHAKKTHNQRINAETMLKIYDKIINNENS